jgi:hypothetical protein
MGESGFATNRATQSIVGLKMKLLKLVPVSLLASLSAAIGSWNKDAFDSRQGQAAVILSVPQIWSIGTDGQGMDA